MHEIIIQAPAAHTRHTLEPTQPAPPPAAEAEPPPKHKQLLVDSLVRALVTLPSWAQSKPVWLDVRGTAHPLESWSSYRGCYECIALDPTPNPQRPPITVADLINSLRSAVGSEMRGYKGGKYPIDWGTPIYVSPYGEASGLMAVGVYATNDRVVILTEQEDD